MPWAHLRSKPRKRSQTQDRYKPDRLGPRNGDAAENSGKTSVLPSCCPARSVKSGQYAHFCMLDLANGLEQSLSSSANNDQNP